MLLDLISKPYLERRYEIDKNYVGGLFTKPPTLCYSPIIEILSRIKTLIFS